MPTDNSTDPPPTRTHPIFEPDELDHIRDLAPTEPADIAVRLAQAGLATQHDHLVVDTTERRADPGLTIPTWHIGEVGVLVNDRHHWTRSLTEDCHDTQSRLTLSAHCAAITALARMTEVHEALAAAGPGVRRPNLLGVQHAADQARHALGRAAAELDTYFAGVPHGAPRRATAARATTGRTQPIADDPAPAAAPAQPPGAARRR